MRIDHCCGDLILEAGDGDSKVTLSLKLTKDEVGKVIRGLIDYARSLKREERAGIVDPDDPFAVLACVVEVGSCRALWGILDDERRDSCRFTALYCCLLGVDDCGGVGFGFTLDDVMGW